MYELRKGWLSHLSGEVYDRLCNCRTIRADLQELVNAKWLAYKETGKAEKGFTKEDALVAVLELLDCNSRYFDLTVDEYNELCNGGLNMKMINKASGEAVYFNPVTKAGKEAWVIQGIGSTVVIGRDRQKRKSRVFAQYHQAEAYLARHGFEAEKYN